MLYDIANSYAQEILTQENEGNRVFEAVVGTVTDNKDPKKLGRVKAKYPIFSEQDTSDWIPVSMMGAGKNRGWFFIPEVGDEVLVMFEQGQVESPMIVGCMWNGKDKPADKNSGGNPRRVIKSRGGSKITLDDEKGKIIIEDGAGKGKITFDTEAKKVIFESLEGDVCLQTPEGDMTIVAKSAEIKADQNIEIHAGEAMQWGSDATVTIKGGDCVTLSGSKVNLNNGSAQMPPQPDADPKDVDDPYGS